MSLVNLKSNYSEFNKNWFDKLNTQKTVDTKTKVQQNIASYSKTQNPIDKLLGTIPSINRNFGKNSNILSNGLQKINQNKKTNVLIPDLYKEIIKDNSNNSHIIPVEINKRKDLDKLSNFNIDEINKDVKQSGNITVKDNSVNTKIVYDKLKDFKLFDINNNINISGRNESSNVEIINTTIFDLTKQTNFKEQLTNPTGRNESSNVEIKDTILSGRHKSIIQIDRANTEYDLTNQTNFKEQPTNPGSKNINSDVKLFTPETSGRNEVSFIDVIKGEIRVSKEIPREPNTNINVSGKNEISHVNVGNNSILEGRHETSPFLPSKIQISGRFLGESNVYNKSQISGRFLGETTPFNTSALSGRHIVDTSNLNIDGNPTGINFFSDVNANGFTVKQKTTQYNHESSIYVWKGNNIPETNFFSDKHFTGFKSFARLFQTFLVNRNSQYTFENEAPTTDFFSNVNAKGFTKNMQLLATDYNLESSIYVWKGNNAPETNFFSDANVTKGFHKFAQLYDTKYLTESSIYVWKGDRNSAPVTDFFTNINHFGFHKFAQLYDTKYNTQSSIYVWKGGRNEAPVTDFFINDNAVGFHKFAQLYDTKYLTESSIYVWKGNKDNAPSTNYFENLHNTGFTKFAKMYESEFKRDTSIFTFIGGSDNAPATDYFINDYNTGFSKFAKMYESEFKRDTSIYVWKGNNIPETNFFVNTYNTGFSKFAKMYESEFKSDVSQYVWVGDKNNAPTTNFFVDSYNTGFTKFVNLYQSEFKSDASIHTWKGGSTNAPSTNFFVDSYNTGFTTFAKQNETEFIPDTSIHTWKGGSTNAPSVDFFANDKVSGFDNFFNDVNNTKYDPNKSILFNPNIETYNVDVNTSELLDDIPNRENINPMKYASNGDGINNLQNNSPSVRFYNTPGNNASTKFGQMYKKFNLRRDSYNPDILGVQPFILRGFQDGKLEEPERWGFGAGFDEGLVRGGVTVNAERSLLDVARLSKFMASGKGLLSIAKNVGLYLTNPDTESHPFISSPIASLRNTQIYNPLSVTLQAAVGDKGSHLLPFGINPADAYPKYEDTVKDRNILSDVKVMDAIIPSTLPGDQGQQNRLLMLTKELFPTHLKISFSNIFDFKGKIINKLSSKNGGINSTYGIGPTLITRATNSREWEDTADYIFNTPTLQYNSADNKNSISGTKNIDLFKISNPQWESVFQQSILNRYLFFADGAGKILDKDSSRQFILKNPFIKKHLLDQNTELNKPAQNATLPSNVEIGLKNYQTLAYDKLNRSVFLNPPNPNALKKFNDFRLELDNNDTKGFSGNPDISNYKENNLEDKYGFGEHGKVSNGSAPDRGDYRVSTGNADKVNLIDFQSKKPVTRIKDVYGETKDLVDFYFTGTQPVIGDDLIVFRAIIGNISDTFSPSWSSQTYIGRADPVYVYNSYERSVSFDLKVVATSNEELRPMWRKLNALASYTGPEYTKAGYIRGPMLRFTLGNLFQKTPVFIESLSYSIDNSTNTWEINRQEEVEAEQKPPTLQLPKIVDVSLGLKIIGNFRPQVRGTMYSLFDTNEVGKPIGGSKRNFFTDVELGDVTDESQYNKMIDSGSNNP